MTDASIEKNKEKTSVSLALPLSPPAALSVFSYLLRELGDGLGVDGLLLVVGGHGFEGYWAWSF